LDAVDVESMQRILGLSILQLADAVDAARGAVAEHLAANEGGGL
jgi:predicted lipid carrier protein YhbT